MTINDTTAQELEQLAKVEAQCPPWCHGQHAQAYREGCSFRDAAEHLSYDHGDFMTRLSNPYSERVEREGGARWAVQLRQHTHLWQDERVGLALPFVQLEVAEGRGGSRSVMQLTMGEARSLAAVLLHVVSQEELGTHK